MHKVWTIFRLNNDYSSAILLTLATVWIQSVSNK